ncbi:MAG: extracellular solute-binding protein [Hyphomicrobium sp.]
MMAGSHPGHGLFTKTGAFVLTLAALFVAAAPVLAEPRHGLSAFGVLKYPPGFSHFDYVNPDAPKGGRLSMIGTAGRITFDSFNNFILKGDPAQGLGLLFDSLMTRAFDETDAIYGLVASSAEVAPDGKSVVFHMRPQAKFADGSPVTAEDAVFSFETLKEKGHPSLALPLRDVTKAEALDPHTVRYTFEGDLTRDLPRIVATLPLLSKAYYTEHPFKQTSLDRPLGSGPYKIANFKPGTYVTYKRRPDYWAKDLNVNRGRFNFDELRYEYYRDRTLELEGLLSGIFDLREEFTSVNWATSYNVPALKDGRLIRLTLPDDSPSGAQGFFINTRRDKFKDPRVREALGLAFDFEWSNKNLFFGLYDRTHSFFQNSDMMAVGPPSAEELKLLEPFRDRLPQEVFGKPYLPPVTDATGRNRENLRRAKELLNAAGFADYQDPGDGKVLDVEILTFSPSFERIINPYIQNLKKIGINASLRRVDPAQYERRMKTFDFDVTTQRYTMNLTPSVELKSFWGSEAAGIDGSFNLAGISDPVVDALIDKVVAAKTRDELVTTTRAVDRVLRTGHYWVPHWYKASHNLAFWNKFSRPSIKPKYDRGVITTWWFDPARAAELKKK